MVHRVAAAVLAACLTAGCSAVGPSDEDIPVPSVPVPTTSSPSASPSGDSSATASVPVPAPTLDLSSVPALVAQLRGAVDEMRTCTAQGAAGTAELALDSEDARTLVDGVRGVVVDGQAYVMVEQASPVTWRLADAAEFLPRLYELNCRAVLTALEEAGTGAGLHEPVLVGSSEVPAASVRVDVARWLSSLGAEPEGLEGEVEVVLAIRDGRIAQLTVDGSDETMVTYSWSTEEMAIGAPPESSLVE